MLHHLRKKFNAYSNCDDDADDNGLVSNYVKDQMSSYIFLLITVNLTKPHILDF